MPTYVWKGKNRSGAVQEGTLVAKSKDEVKERLRKQQIVATGIKEKGREFALPKFGGGISQKEISIFTRQFSVMIDSGLPLVQALEILAAQNNNPNFQKVLFAVRTDVESGSSLSDAMFKQPKVFDNLYCNLIAAGEAGGILDTILRRLAVYIEKAVKLKSQVKSALTYPVSVMGIAVVVVWVILRFVIPTFGDLFEGLGAELPLPTKITIKLSRFLGAWGWLVILIIIATIFLLNRYHKTYKGRRVLDGALLKAPVFGPLMRKIGVARFCRTLSTLAASGVSILEGLEITAKTSGNAILEDAIMAVRKAVEGGRTIAEPLAETKQFPDMVTQMISVGEKTGALDAMLGKIADFYEDEVDEAVENLMALIEPVMIVFLGVVIGGIVISMYMPMFDMIQKVG